MGWRVLNKNRELWKSFEESLKNKTEQKQVDSSFRDINFSRTFNGKKQVD